MDGTPFQLDARRETPLTGRTAWVRKLSAPIREFVATESAGAVILLAASLVALLWANSPWGPTYEQLWSTQLGLTVEIAAGIQRVAGHIALLAGDLRTAEAELRQAFEALERIGDTGHLASVAGDLAVVLVEVEGREREVFALTDVSSYRFLARREHQRTAYEPMSASAIEVPQSNLGLGGATRRMSEGRTLFRILALHRVSPKAGVARPHV